MQKIYKIATVILLCMSSLFLMISFFTARAADKSSPIVKLRILETTDLHAHILPYDYTKDASSSEFGLANTSILIEQARAEVPKTNSMLFDVGDTIQGTPLAYYLAKVKKLKPGEIHPVFQTMNMLNYDAATLGNHDFNYGLDFLHTAMATANFPFVNANIYINDHDNDESNDLNAYTPYLIMNKKVSDANGNLYSLKVGVIGFAPPQIMDKNKLVDQIKTKDIVQTAKKFIPEMKAKGADLVIVLAHSGLGAKTQGQFRSDNAVYSLSKVPGIDAILFGHKHKLFPGGIEFNNIPGIDNIKGTINGVPAVEAGYWGNHLGLIDLTLRRTDSQWKVEDFDVKSL